ncbi:MAG: hypothetical protein J0I68_00850 [Achromobacter sp.]|jgi:hypothetical protein|uniref:Uncharacterized protein n=2 Tax=Achromobacter insuavis TaxID=1287735 RepID=A0A6J5AF40_9BURK|nr:MULTISPECIES: hypothetical protein [Achromobacter]MBN9637051.1 hypothetical protein [Achromobacter sp.]CAB3665316.1 hypothetical protein LMG26845_03489 [Achromobacter insuavis]CUJ26173.1 Uncharacterised protein [Achromobacter sp. 2789STDY5608633]CUJ79728.1 Uncharacterised protein [Achromobacter sp. 2789STDY5608628]
MALRVRADSYLDHHGHQFTWDFSGNPAQRVALSARWGEVAEISVMQFGPAPQAQ